MLEWACFGGHDAVTKYLRATGARETLSTHLRFLISAYNPPSGIRFPQPTTVSSPKLATQMTTDPALYPDLVFVAQAQDGSRRELRAHRLVLLARLPHLLFRLIGPNYFRIFPTH